ncbi:MAG: hypothetical protein ACPGO5_02990 [Patescibacteria group bacterium]
MNKEVLQEISIALVLLILVVMFIDPLMLIMPGELAMFVMLLAAILFLVFAMFVWKERALDEREEYHRMIASRIGWLTGATLLMIGLLVQGLKHDVDPWLVIALSGMVIAKVFARMYGRLKK